MGGSSHRSSIAQVVSDESNSSEESDGDERTRPVKKIKQVLKEHMKKLNELTDNADCKRKIKEAKRKLNDVYRDVQFELMFNKKKNHPGAEHLPGDLTENTGDAD